MSYELTRNAKKANRRTRSMQPPCGYKHSLILTETNGRKGGPPRKKHATAPRLCTLSASSHPVVQHGGPGPHVMEPAHRLLRAKKPHRYLRQCRVFSTAEPVQRFEAAPRVTQQCQLSATITGQSAAGIGVTVDMAKSESAVIAATDVRKRRPNRPQARILSQSGRVALSHGIKTTHPCSVPRTTRARATDAP
jgi:hypothetical protein